MASWSARQSEESAMGNQNVGLDVRKPLLEDTEDGLRTSMNTDRPVEVPKASEFAKSIVYGGLDAIVTSFALVASISGSNHSSGAVLVLGFANLLADGMSMGFGDFVSSSTEKDLAFTYRKVMGWKVRKDPHSQILDLISTYKAHGMDEGDAQLVVDCFSKYRNLFLDQKMTMEQGLVTPDPSESLWKHGCVTFLSFLGFGCTPLLAYVILNPFTSNNQIKFAAAAVVTLIALVVLGLAKAKISGQKYLSSVLMVVLNGGIAAGVAYLVGWLLTDVLGIED
ncbi:hypothetical protein GOP47_0015774 [Adiantum capillus-veneris]|uniref:Uncharacterized protein n=1 Tax=Adiantum capillus-veneris TaxID=13818 RepID=A0A9D4ZBI5_ADICA|nr:hypothetical protein GOP47_0015774 [Adiantum capillus-veneris]